MYDFIMVDVGGWGWRERQQHQKKKKKKKRKFCISVRFCCGSISRSQNRYVYAHDGKTAR